MRDGYQLWWRGEPGATVPQYEDLQSESLQAAIREASELVAKRQADPDRPQKYNRAELVAADGNGILRPRIVEWAIGGPDDA